MNKQIQELAENLFPQLQEMRRHLHAHPELSFEEQATAAYVADQLQAIGITAISTGVAGTGVVALIKGNNPDKKCVALRADMDALPITEANETSYCSQNPGVMHACGHDVHTTCLLGAARILHQLRDSFEGTVKLIFQPGEEKSPGGASLMIAAGALENLRPEAIFGLHVYPQLPAGQVGFKAGKYMASADEIYLTIHGKGGHAALPEETVDPIAISALIITALQQVVSRKAGPMRPTVLTFGKIEGGHTTNVIPETVQLAGTFRALDEAWRQEALGYIRNITQQIAQANGANASIEIPAGYPCLHNDIELTRRAQSWAVDYLENKHVHELPLRMGAEDFSFYTQKIPGCFFRIGTNTDNEKYTTPVHNAHFDIDEKALITGTGMMALMAIQELQQV